MPDLENNFISQSDSDIYNKVIKPIPKAQKNIGIDQNNELEDQIIIAGDSGIDFAELNKFTTISQSRDQLYTLLDSMANDSKISSILEVYAEDATERNDDGKIVWAQSADGDTTKYINFLLDSLNIDKQVYQWIYSLCKYGDVYIRLFRESEIKNSLLDNEDEQQTLNEDIYLKTYKKSDKIVHYVEMVPNPAEIFELTKFGKTCGYIEAPVTSYATNNTDQYLLNGSNFNYRFKKTDINIYNPLSFVHGSLQDNTPRVPETVQIFRNDDDYNSNSAADTYKVKRGQSLLYTSYKDWRQLMLLENSVLLNRLTKSSIVRLVQTEVGDMGKEAVQRHLMNIKTLIEQKQALNESNAMSEYTNPGPVDNTIYIPTHNGKGVITTSQIGGDVDVKSLIDLDYFKDRLYSALRVPKQFLGDTDDAAGFSGGSSLALISSRYAKAIKRIQTIVAQMITDIINIILVNNGQMKYINKFKIKLQQPTTQEEKDKKEYASSAISVVRDTMDLLSSDIDDSITKLELLKSLLSSTIENAEVMGILQEYIDKLKEEPEQVEEETSDEVDLSELNDEENPESGSSGENLNDKILSINQPVEGEETAEPEEQQNLPNMEEIGLDFTDSSNFEA